MANFTEALTKLNEMMVETGYVVGKAIAETCDRVLEAYSMATKEQSTAARLLGVEDGQPFMWDNTVYVIRNGLLCEPYSASPKKQRELLRLIEHKDEIEYHRQWTEEEKEAAKWALNFGYQQVTKHEYGETCHIHDDEISIQCVEPGFFPSLKKGETVRLEDIK